jgi:hypothetical protein
LIYEWAERWFPEVFELARSVGRGKARTRLLDLYLTSVGAATEALIAPRFHRRQDDVTKACAALARDRLAAPIGKLAGEPDERWATLASCDL